MTPFAEIENVSLPAVTLTVGSPNRVALAGGRMKGPFRPVCTSVKDPSSPHGGHPSAATTLWPEHHRPARDTQWP